MSVQQSILACLLVAASVCQAQTGRLSVTASGNGTMQPWLVGLAATVGFLFLVFTLLIIKRLMKKDRREEDSLIDHSLEMEPGKGDKQTPL
ncbi:hypothetical protein SKAU_G00050820 [Synaphobranchus kaupii]|uniref:Small integral membrane protein 24 n=1 Tax=Synaphobranchus kaupii TaxID=118154 RepID=A0A9Q1G3Z1_SYNKA|nr:hypothetical protein SKAU_G00050820 [Synaphobranchus kaupii]